MANRLEIRRSIGAYQLQGRRLMELFGTVVGTPTTTTVDLNELAFYNGQSAAYFDGYGLSGVSGVGAGIERRVTNLDTTNNRLTFSPLYSTFDTTSVVELWQSGLSATAVNDCINRAIDLIRNEMFIEVSSTLYAFEDGRVEYPIWDGFHGAYKVQVLEVGGAVGVAPANATTFRALFDTTARTRLAMGFKVATDGFYRGVVLWLRKQGTISTERTLTCVIDNDNGSGLPDIASTITGASATFGTDDIFTELTPCFFDFGRPVRLTASTQYHIDLRISGSADATNHIQWAENDDVASYADGALATYSGSAWTAVGGSDMAFSLIPWSNDWTDLPGTEWGILHQSVTVAKLVFLGREGWPAKTQFGSAVAPSHGAPIRVLGVRRANRPSDDTTELEVPRAFLESEALANVLERAGSAAEMVAYYHTLAARELKDFRVRRNLWANFSEVNPTV